MSESTRATTTPPMTIASCSNVRTREMDATEACRGIDPSEEHARHLAHLRALPEVRAERIAKIKQMIADGTFDTDAKLSVAIDRMLEELRHLRDH